VVHYLLGDLSLHVDEICLVDKGLILLYCEIGKEFSAIVGNFFLFHLVLVYNPWRSIRAYTLHQVHLICYWISHFSKVARRSTRAYTLLDLPS
jgi:hypothetical protein